MKKPLITSIMVMVSFLTLASIAQADSVFSVSFGNGYPYERHNNYERHERYNSRFYHSRCYPAPPYYQNYPYNVYRTTVIRTYEPQPTQTVIYDSQEKFGISDIIALSKAGVSDDIIINKISKTRSIYHLTVEEVEVLRKEGVSSRVVNFMLREL